jgi:hypothetical protein
MLLSTLLDIFLQKSFLRLSTRATPAVVSSLSAKFLASTTAQARLRPLLSLDLPQRPPRHLDSPKALPPFQGDTMLDLHTLLARPHAPNAPVSANVDYIFETAECQRCRGPSSCSVTMLYRRLLRAGEDLWEGWMVRFCCSGGSGGEEVWAREVAGTLWVCFVKYVLYLDGISSSSVTEALN